MKITIITLFVCLAFTMSAQVSLSSNSFRTKFDSSFAPLLLRTIPHGVLYDRVVPWAALDMTVSGDTVSTDLLAQAWHELDLSRTASPVMGHIISRTLRDSILGHKITNRFFPISINARITILDTLADTDGRLISKASGYDIDTTKATPFISRNALMSALSQQEFVTNTAYAFTVSDKYIYTNDRIGISSIQLIEPVNGINITKAPGSSGSITFTQEGKLDIQVKTTYTDHSTIINTQTIDIRNPPSNDPCKRQRHIVASDIPFQGEGEAIGTTSLGAYFIYYHKDGNGNCEKLLKKPIIICDGFDPEDANKIGDLEDYFKYRDLNNMDIQSIDKMTELGFDVIMLNFPVLGDADQLDSRSDVKTSLNTTISANMRDGGSDFIERNAMLMVKLIQQVNDSLVVNGSSEQLCIMGPSMGGLITKYALAYMEQQHAKSVPKMNHNARIWCSFDSPHHGANVPIGNMVGLVQLAERANSESAANKFRIKLSNPAAREQLVTQTALNSGETIFQNNTATLRQTFLNNINTNGLTGSDGWPVNLKRIALSNASDNGVENGIPGDEIMHIKANKLGKKVFEFQTKFMGRTNESVDITDIFFTTKWLIFLWPHNPDPVSLLNSNPNGAMENLPGSYLGSNQDVFDGILEELKNEKTNIKIQSCKPNHTFMPVISTLAFNNTNVDWSQVLNNRNLVCTGEIPFDAYFIDGRNNPHITITEANYNWLEYQFLNGVSGCDPVCGAFTITGDQQICDGNTNTVHTYTFNGGIDAGETLTWSVSGDLVINSSSGNTAGIKITAANGSGIVTATLKNACGDRVVQNFQVQVGKPNIYLTSALN